ncbi:MAG: hypothetical protein II960_10805, partial [Synergistaceae bacterium]|nr:hypothetical protein [Synergistaceae bacterium]
MTKKILLFLFMLLIIPQNLFAAEQKELAADYVTRMQNEISADIEKLRTLIDTELAEINLTSTDVIQRSKELTALNEKSSDDMASWGYTDEQKELHSQTLSELGVAYSAYAALNSSSNSEIPAEIDASELENIESPDINMSDNLRKEISKVSKGLDVQVFYLQSKLNKLKLDLAEAANLQKKLKGAKEGGDAVELPRTQILNLELLRMNVALSRVQVRTLRKAFDSNVAAIQRLRRRLADMQEKLIFPQELLNSNLEKIQTRINDLTTEMNDARKALDSAHSSLVRARATVGSADMSVMTNSTSAYMARSTRVNYWEYMVLLLEDEIALTRESQQVWKDRYKLFHDNATGEELWKIRDTSQARINELQRQLEGVRTAENTILREIETTQASLNAEGITGTVQQNILLAIENKRKIISEIFNRYEA